MKLRRIDLDDDELPLSVTVQMSADEALYLALLLGKQTGNMQEETLPGGASLDLFSCLSFVMNSFYEGGVREAREAYMRNVPVIQGE